MSTIAIVSWLAPLKCSRTSGLWAAIAPGHLHGANTTGTPVGPVDPGLDTALGRNVLEFFEDCLFRGNRPVVQGSRHGATAGQGWLEQSAFPVGGADCNDRESWRAAIAGEEFDTDDGQRDAGGDDLRRLV